MILLSNLQSYIGVEMKRLLSMTMMLSLLLPLILCGCVRGKPYYFNDSDKIYTDDARKGVCGSVDFPCVVMSQGQYRKITTVNP